MNHDREWPWIISIIATFLLCQICSLLYGELWLLSTVCFLLGFLSFCVCSDDDKRIYLRFVSSFFVLLISVALTYYFVEQKWLSDSLKSRSFSYLLKRQLLAYLLGLVLSWLMVIRQKDEPVRKFRKISNH